MKAFLFTIIFSIPLLVFPQECKFKENKIDEFTGHRRIGTKKSLIKLDMISQYSISFYSNDTILFLDLERVNTGGGAIVVGTNDALSLKLNDTVIRIYPADIYSSQFNGSSTILNARYVLTKTHLLFLSDKKITNVRLAFNQNFEDIKVTEDRAEKSRLYAQCLASELKK